MLTSTITLYKNAYNGLTRRMWLLSVVMLINRSGTMVLPFMTLYCNSRGYTETQGGFAVAVYGIGSLFGALIGGRLCDKVGFYYTQFFALFAGGIMFIVLGQMNSYPAICICIFFTSMINEAFRPANSTAIAHYSDPQNRTQSFSLNRLAINLGWGIGSALAGMLASISYHLLFWVDGFTNITAAIALLILLPKVSLAQQHHSLQVKTAKNNSPFTDKTFLIFVGFMLLFALCFFQLFTTVPLYFKEGLHLNEFWIGVVMAMNGIIIAFVEMVIVFKLEGAFPYLKLMKYGTLVLSVAYFMLNLPLANGFLLASLVILLVTAAEIIAMPFMNSYYIARTTTENRGRYAALYTMAWSSAQVIGSLSGTQLIHSIGYFYLWWIIGAICIIAALGFNYLQGRSQ
jgi:predicted MFS family arabinose efflux permease